LLGGISGGSLISGYIIQVSSTQLADMRNV